jgi:hypothetical protein
VRGRYAATAERRRGRLCGYPCTRPHPSGISVGLVFEVVDDRIKKPTQADDAAHVVSVLPLTAKSSLYDKHYQNEQDMYRIPVELERKANHTFHRSTFPAPNVLALGAYCVERSRTPESRSALPSAINVIRQIEALPVYMEVA